MRKKKIQENCAIAVPALFCCLLWGSAFPCIKIGYEWFAIEDAGSRILFAGVRFFLAGLMTMALFIVREKQFPFINRSSVPAVAGQGLLQTSVQYFLFYLGLANTTGARGAVIVGANAFFSILAAKLLLKEDSLNKYKIGGCIIGFAGVIMVNLTPKGISGAFSWNGEGLVLLSAVAYGLSNVTVKMIAKRERTDVITAYQLLIGGAALILTGYVFGGTMGAFTWKSGILFFYMALLSTAAFSIWAMLLKNNPVSKVTPYGFSNPVFGTLLSGIFLGENIFTWHSFAALGLVSMGIIFVNFEKKG